MTTLIIATSLSRLFANEILTEQTRASNDTIVIATNPDVNRSLKDMGVPSQYISTDVGESQAQKDVAFRQLAMPGVFGDTMFLGTQLPIYKVLSIDRLSFWHHSQNGLLMGRYVEALRWDRLMVSFDVSHYLPFVALNEAKRRNAISIAIKTQPLRTNEVYDLAKRLQFDLLMVEAEDERKYLQNAGYSGVITVKTPIEKKERTVASPKKDELKKGLGVSGNNVIGVVFDKQYEWQARRFMQLHSDMANRLLFFAFDDRSKGLFAKCMKPFTLSLHTNNLTEACDRIIAFGWNDYLSNLQNVTVIDYFGINRAKEIAPTGTMILEE